jgi:hypothetical protein
VAGHVGGAGAVDGDPPAEVVPGAPDVPADQHGGIDHQRPGGIVAFQVEAVGGAPDVVRRRDRHPSTRSSLPGHGSVVGQALRPGGDLQLAGVVERNGIGSPVSEADVSGVGAGGHPEGVLHLV